MFLAGIPLPRSIRATGELADLGAMDALLLVTPAQHLRATAHRLSAHVGKPLPAAICSKGIEQSSGKLLSDVLGEAAPVLEPFILSGPSFAADVARGLPTAVTLAGRDEAGVAVFAQAIGSASFRPYRSNDLIGAQIGGAVKNVLAIACGIVEGKRLGASARAALTTRGFAELVRLGTALGAKRETLAGLSGLGDLVLTCNSTQSRNMSLGKLLGEGRSLDDILASRNTVSEGVYTAAVVTQIAEDHNVEMPISAAVRAVTQGRTSVDAAICDLLARPITDET